MSRFGNEDGDWDDEFNGNGWAMWEKRLELALAGKRGRKALAELKEALLALPERRLIAGALCTVGPEARMPEKTLPAGRNFEPVQNYAYDEMQKLLERDGEGVCAIGAYLWFKRVKAGEDPQAAFAALPTIPGYDYGADRETAEAGERGGLAYTLAYELASRNDETWKTMKPEERWQAFVDWIDDQLAKPPLRAPERGRKARLRAAREEARRQRLQLEADARRAPGQQALSL